MGNNAKVTKPQAVITVATMNEMYNQQQPFCYKTASGNHCCNSGKKNINVQLMTLVTKPQAVITVATPDEIPDGYDFACYKTASGNHCCNPENFQKQL